MSSSDPIDIASMPSSPLPSVPLAVALQKAVAMLETLTREQLEDIASGNGSLVYRPGPVRPDPARPDPVRAARREVVHREPTVDLAAAVADINRLSTPTQVSDYLQLHAAEFTVPVLKEIARGLGPTVHATGRTKAQLRRDIVEGTAGFRVRGAAMSGGAWSREQ